MATVDATGVADRVDLAVEALGRVHGFACSRALEGAAAVAVGAGDEDATAGGLS